MVSKMLQELIQSSVREGDNLKLKHIYILLSLVFECLDYQEVSGEN